MSSLRLVVGSFILFGGISLTYAAPPQMRPGKWEIKMQTEMAGMPHQVPPMSTTHCLTSEQAKDPVKGMMKRLQQNRDASGEKCQLVKQSMSERNFHWVVECTGVQHIKSNGEITFDSDVAYHGVITSEIETPQGNMTMTQNLEARRIGECP
jgi:hypothetical protein